MTIITRRHLINTSLAAATAAASTKYTTSSVLADTDVLGEIGRQPFYRTSVGSAEVTVVSDGTIEWEPGILWSDVPEDELEGFLSDFHQPTDRVRLQLNAMVVDLGGRRILIDAGDAGMISSTRLPQSPANGAWPPTGGCLPENLQAAGIDPGSIDAVIFTHLHPDHLWGITDPNNETLIFPNAEYVVAEPELAFWDNEDLPGQMPNDLYRWVAEANLVHIEKIRDRLRTVGAAAEASPGITFMPTHGHSPGHVSIVLESDGETLLSTGDLFAESLIGFEQPHWDNLIDWDAEQGTASRLAFLDQAATDRHRVFGFHLPWPGLGHVARHGNAYRWVKEEWVW
jgi:glyoxylase-like metal-dependent hydrolase (beta-lactamase superfamily II)